MTDPSLIAADGADAEQPTFDSLALSPPVRRAVDELGYTHPTPVQRAVFETAAAGRDVVVQARTGTGKTAAFGLPIVDRLVDENKRAPQVLILSPTRELALQINRELEGLAKYRDIECVAVYGGASMQPQVDAIRRGAQIIAGTPGRVLDHLERGTLDPKTIRALILDESDEMLSMGFLPQITRIMEQLPKKHQTLLFSATLPADVKRIAETRLTDPEFITLSGDHIGALSIDHFIYRSAGNKAEELVQVLEIENPESAIIFCNTRDQTKRLCAALNRKGFSADWLNADLAQNDREKVMKATREGRLRFLVCTDVAARGIDISHLTHVINADFPESTEAYVHRTGRTGRAGRTGTAISMITPQDVGNLYMLRLTYKIFPLERELPSVGDLQTRKEADLVEFLYSAFSTSPQLPIDRSLARRILTSDVAETIVAGLLRDHLGAHPSAADEAADARRAKNPPPDSEKVKSKDKEKKNKKKDKDKARKKDKGESSKKSSKQKSDDRDETGFRGEESAAAAAVPQTSPQTEDRPQRAQAALESPPSQPRAARPERTDEPPKAKTNGSSSRLAPPNPQPPRSSDEKGLEVVSASALLSDEELAILKGDDDSKDRKLTQKKSFRHNDEDVGRIFVDAGKRDDVYRDDFLETLKDNGFDASKVVFVNIRDTHSFIGVQTEALEEAVAALDGREVAGLEVSAEKARPRRS